MFKLQYQLRQVIRFIHWFTSKTTKTSRWIVYDEQEVSILYRLSRPNFQIPWHIDVIPTK